MEVRKVGGGQRVRWSISLTNLKLVRFTTMMLGMLSFGTLSIPWLQLSTSHLSHHHFSSVSAIELRALKKLKKIENNLAIKNKEKSSSSQGKVFLEQSESRPPHEKKSRNGDQSGQALLEVSADASTDPPTVASTAMDLDQGTVQSGLYHKQVGPTCSHCSFASAARRLVGGDPKGDDWDFILDWAGKMAGYLFREQGSSHFLLQTFITAIGAQDLVRVKDSISFEETISIISTPSLINLLLVHVPPGVTLYSYEDLAKLHCPESFPKWVSGVRNFTLPGEDFHSVILDIEKTRQCSLHFICKNSWGGDNPFKDIAIPHTSMKENMQLEDVSWRIKVAAVEMVPGADPQKKIKKIHKKYSSWKENEYSGLGFAYPPLAFPAGERREYRWGDGLSFQGFWKDGKPDPDRSGPEDIISYPDGRMYHGEISWSNRGFVKHGKGVNHCANGEKYVGEYRDGKEHGPGAYYSANGEKKDVGEYKDGKKHGKFTHYWANGDKYVGEYRDEKKHGKFTYYRADGSKYVVEYRDGKKHGKLTDYRADGSKYVWEYRDGKKFDGDKMEGDEMEGSF